MDMKTRLFSMVKGYPMWTRYLYRSGGVDPKTGEMTYYTYAPRYDLTKPVMVQDANGKTVQKLDRWGEPVFEVLTKKEIDASGKEIDAPVAKDRLTKTTQVSEAAFFLGKSSHPDLYGGFNTRLNYAGFDLGLDFSFQLGGYIIDDDYASLMYGFLGELGGSNIHKDALTKSWTPTPSPCTVPSSTNWCCTSNKSSNQCRCILRKRLLFEFEQYQHWLHLAPTIALSIH